METSEDPQDWANAVYEKDIENWIQSSGTIEIIPGNSYFQLGFSNLQLRFLHDSALPETHWTLTALSVRYGWVLTVRDF